MRRPSAYKHVARDVPAVLYLNDTSTAIVTVADNAALRSGQDVTMMCWARCLGNTQAGYICGRLNGSINGGYGMYLDASGTAPLLQFMGTTSGPQTATLNLHKNLVTDWHHYAVSFYGSAASGARVFKFYVDGDLVYSVTGSTEAISHPSSIDYIIGNRTSGASTATYFGGHLWDHKMFMRVLTDAEVAKASVGRFVDPTSLVLDMPLDDGSGTNARNLIRSGAGSGALGATAAWWTSAVYPAVMPLKERSTVY